MPNHVKNRLVINGNPDEIDLILASYVTDGTLDFQRILPLRGVYWGDTGEFHRRIYGPHIALDVARETWGTKWTAYRGTATRRGPNTLVLDFATAWNAPHPVILELMRLVPATGYDHFWCCEGRMTWGRIVYSNQFILAASTDAGKWGPHPMTGLDECQDTAESIYALLWPERVPQEEP